MHVSMYVHVKSCIYRYTCICTCTYMGVHMHMYVDKHMRMLAYMYTCVGIITYSHSYTHTYDAYIYNCVDKHSHEKRACRYQPAHTITYLCICVHGHACVYVSVYVHMRPDTYIFICMSCMDSITYVHVYTCIDAHICTFTRITKANANDNINTHTASQRSTHLYMYIASRCMCPSGRELHP